jgi:1,2-diacylglycerol 3-beta-glucosyltransferase
MNLTVGIVGVLGLVLVGTGLAQQCFVVWFGLRHDKQAKQDEEACWENLVTPSPLTVVAMVAGLNEELVIADTVSNLLRQGMALVVVVDDGSEDRTSEVARGASGGDDRVLVVQRVLPNARLGKGPALNHGFQELTSWAARRNLDPACVVVCVMDADGQLSDNAVPLIKQAFADPSVGGAQLPVSIRNNTSILTRIQDLEFWGVSAFAQIARMETDSVSLGGNGQFTRLSALLQLRRDPWSACLTEDLDLAVALAKRGWKLTSVPEAFVSQQAVETVRRLLRQRTRWFQGHMDCSRHIPDLWRSPHARDRAVVEMTYYLMIPMFMVLPWSFLYTFGLGKAVHTLFFGDAAPLFGSMVIGRAVVFVPWYLLTTGPMWISAWVYHRRRQHPLLQSMLLGQALVVFQFVTFVACWRAFFRLMLGREGWVKTSRIAEQLTAERRTEVRVSGEMP